MDLRKIEITEATLKLGAVTYYAGDVKSFPAAEAAEYIRLGWAKDAETGETGERKPGGQPLRVDPVTLAVGG